MSGKFQKCSHCQLKPATVRCLECINNGIISSSNGSSLNSIKQQQSGVIYCYNCDNQVHKNQQKHIKQLIPYSEMVKQNNFQNESLRNALQSSDGIQQSSQKLINTDSLKKQTSQENKHLSHQQNLQQIQVELEKQKLNISTFSPEFKQKQTEKDNSEDNIQKQQLSYQYSFNENDFQNFINNASENASFEKNIDENKNSNSQTEQKLVNLTNSSNKKKLKGNNLSPDQEDFFQNVNNNKQVKSEIKSIETRFKIKFQGQENIINLLKNQIQQNEINYQKQIQEIEKQNQQKILQIQNQLEATQTLLEKERQIIKLKEKEFQNEKIQIESQLNNKNINLNHQNEIQINLIKDQYEQNIQELQSRNAQKQFSLNDKDKRIFQLENDLIESNQINKNLQFTIDQQQKQIVLLNERVNSIIKKIEILDQRKNEDLNTNQNYNPSSNSNYNETQKTKQSYDKFSITKRKSQQK